MHTIRGKIRLAYLSFALIIGAISLLAFLDLHYLDLRIEQGAVIAQLKENGLEMRRHEKNYFLYLDEGSRQEALRLASPPAPPKGRLWRLPTQAALNASDLVST